MVIYAPQMNVSIVKVEHNLHVSRAGIVTAATGRGRN
jgi:hypothetical protein